MDSRAEPPQAGEDYDLEDYDFEAPEADAAEQQRTAGDELSRWDEAEAAARVPPEADPADHADQVRSVEEDEDDYR
ncbi:MAG: hypothetical protein GEV11_13615 [Streptosporangiales bacterium]|nr:hypothetical protein [Streptosporangiales bacterium]